METVDSRQRYRDSVNTQLPYRPAIVILKFSMMSSICQQYSTLHFMDVTSIFPICRRRRLLGNVFRYISDISRQGYLVRRRLKLELPSAMSGPCQHFTPLRNLTQTFSDGISSTPSESTDWWMSLPYLQITWDLWDFWMCRDESLWCRYLSSHLVKQEKRTKMTFDNVEIESTWCWSTPCSQSLEIFNVYHSKSY